MLTSKVQKHLDDLIKLAKEKDSTITSTIFYDAYTNSDHCIQNGEETNSMLDIQEYFTGHDISIVVNDTDTEDETEFYPTADRIVPYDSTKINIVMEPMAIESLLNRLADEDDMGIEMNTSFQRKAGLWSPEKKSRLIESFLIKIPLPAFYFDTSNESRWLVIDGLQRISAIKEFIIDKSLRLTGMEFYTDLNGLNYDQLPKQFSRRIKESSIVTYKVKAGTPMNVKYYIFKRLNTGGLELKAQEIRHALYQGAATEVLARCAQSKEFLSATCYSISSDRMLDQEFVLRFYAVCYYGIEKYRGAPEEFLNEAMDCLNKKPPADFDYKFAEVLTVIEKIFGRNSFRRIVEGGNRRQINKAIFECWCRCIYGLTLNQKRTVLDNKTHIYEGFVDLCKDEKFNQAVKGGDKTSYLCRFEQINNLVMEMIK